MITPEYVFVRLSNLELTNHMKFTNHIKGEKDDYEKFAYSSIINFSSSFLIQALCCIVCVFWMCV